MSSRSNVALTITVITLTAVAIILIIPQIDLEPGVLQLEQMMLVVIGLLILPTTAFVHSLAPSLPIPEETPTRALVSAVGPFNLHC